jgi:hypothetical protein
MICAIDGALIGARSGGELGRRLARFDLANCEKFTGVDAKGEKWMFFKKEMLLAPEFIIRPMRKTEIIRLFNQSAAAKENGWLYPESVIPNRRLDAIVGDIVALLTNRRPGIKSQRGSPEPRSDNHPQRRKDGEFGSN